MLNIQASFVANAALRPRLPYEPIADFACVGKMARGPLPQVPTIAESGVPGYMAEFWWGLVVPVRTPAEITARLGGELARALQSADLRQSFAGEGAEPATMGAEAFQRFVSNEINRWRKVAQETGIKPE
jgi:tripartite-type tricarboxylate transporter receptor subunit TctC